MKIDAIGYEKNTIGLDWIKFLFHSTGRETHVFVHERIRWWVNITHHHNLPYVIVYCHTRSDHGGCAPTKLLLYT